MNRRQIEAILLEEVSRARQDYERARGEFLEATSEAGSGLPQPDGIARIANAGVKKSAALQHYAAALREFDAFLLSGAIPERFRKLT